MRNACVSWITNKLKQSNENIFFLTGDLGFSVLEEIQTELKEKFLNMGIAEANMISVAASMGFDKTKVITYSIVPFTTFRCLEQIRNDVCYHKSNVLMLGVGVGYGYGQLGPTHHAVDDFSAMNAIPNLNIYSPNDPRELEVMLPEIWETTRPCYLRLGKGREPIVSYEITDQTDGVFLYGKEKTKNSIVVAGTILGHVIKNFNKHPKLWDTTNILSFTKLKPFPVFKSYSKYLASNILVLQELVNSGGLGNILAQEILSNDFKVSKYRVNGIDDSFSKVVGSSDFLRAEHSLDFEGIETLLTDFI